MNKLLDLIVNVVFLVFVFVGGIHMANAAQGCENITVIRSFVFPSSEQVVEIVHSKMVEAVLRNSRPSSLVYSAAKGIEQFINDHTPCLSEKGFSVSKRARMAAISHGLENDPNFVRVVLSVYDEEKAKHGALVENLKARKLQWELDNPEEVLMQRLMNQTPVPAKKKMVCTTRAALVHERAQGATSVETCVEE